jgi:hypothetical protein
MENVATMDDEKTEALITNLELAEYNLDKLSRIVDQKDDPEGLIGQTTDLVRESLRTLRTYEVQKEIEQFSEE